MLDSAVIQTHRVVILMRALIAFYLSILASALLAQQPHIDSISPAQGPIAGGTFVTIAGANFQGATVTIDKLPVVLPVISATEIHFTTPAHDNGIASIKVASASGPLTASFCSCRRVLPISRRVTSPRSRESGISPAYFGSRP